MSDASVKAWERCPANPNERVYEHECMSDELRCVYCGEPIEPCNCNGCGRFVPASQLKEGIYRCEDCE